MCGIVGYVGNRNVTDVLIKGLKRLEYRGYDSSGVAFFDQGKLHLKKSEGKLVNVEKLLGDPRQKGTGAGIGHTRWATHGKPTTQNAHPHQCGHIVLVHNGIIENYQEIRQELLKNGHLPQSETDSELFGFLVLEMIDAGNSFSEAVRKAFLKVEGACSVVVMSEKDPSTVIGIRNGSPLVAATDPNGGAILASDAQPILEYTQDVVFLESGDMAIATPSGLEIVDYQTGAPVKRTTTHLDWSADTYDKQGHDHYMLKEIFEQPRALVDTLNTLLDRKRTDPFPLAKQPGVDLLEQAEAITIVACGTAYYSGLLAKYWFERWAGRSVSVEVASEYRYRDPVVQPGSLIIAISQSGETADTLAVVREMRRRGVKTLGITNTRGSTLSRETDATFFTSAGPEIGVAATKTFMVQILTLFILSANLGLKRGQDTSKRVPDLFDELIKLPHLLQDNLCLESEFSQNTQKVARAVSGAKGFFFIGRGYSYPLAMEGALKLKEIAYIHAEGYPGGELKHGPIAMIDSQMVVVVLAPHDGWLEKTVSNLQEVKARGAKIIGVGHPQDQKVRQQCDHWISVPLPAHRELGAWDESLYPFLLAPVIQLFSYWLAIEKGTDVDQPRNLAKSVTVE